MPDPRQLLEEMRRRGGPQAAEEVDPNATAGSQREILYFEHDQGEDGVIAFEKATLEIQPANFKAPIIKVDPVFLEVPQRFVGTCSMPSAENRGCNACRGCPYGRKGLKGVGPFNVIIRKGKRIDSVPCYLYYYTPNSDGTPQQIVAYRYDGWELVLDRTSLFGKSARYKWDRDRQQKVLVESIVETKIKDLGPMYAKQLEKEGRDGNRRAKVEGSEAAGRGKLVIPPIVRAEEGPDGGGVRDHADGEGREGRDRVVRQGPRRGKRGSRAKAEAGGPPESHDP